jgi:alkylation response protein AidB-like acyl-CoA dehydrogenase
MYIEFSEEQRMLKESAEKYLNENYPFDARQKIVKSESAFCKTQWQTFADLGWLAMTFAEEAGGFGGGALETMLLSEQLGLHMVVEPYLETIVLGGQLLSSASDEIKTRYLDALISGHCQVAFAWSEAKHHHAMSDVAMAASVSNDGIVLNGSKTVVLNGAAADVVLVLVRTAGEPGQLDGLSLVLVDTDAEGCVRRCYKTYDGRNAAEFSFSNVSVSLGNILGKQNKAMELLVPVLNQCVLSLCSEAVGAMSALLDATVDYTKQRKQFGRAISQFQVLRHRMADMFIALELSRSLMLAAAWKLDHGDADAELTLSALKAKVASAGKFIAHNAIQLHGGIGTTDELNIGHYFKRIAAINSQFGSRDFHLARFARLSQQ